MTKKKKVLCILVPIIVVVAATVSYILFINMRYDYSHLKNSETVVEAMSLTTLKGGTKIKGMSQVAESDFLALYVSKEDASIAVLNKKTGGIWYSNPLEGQEDPKANAVEKANMASQLAITYYDKQRREKNMMSFTDCVEKEQFEIESIDQGIRVTYTFGDLSLGADALPKYITAERFEEKIISKVSDSSKKTIEKRYVASKDKEGFLELLESTKESSIIINKLLGVLEEAGYTEEDLQKESEISGHEVDISREYCTIPLEYRIVEDKLQVNVPCGQIEETESMQVASVEIFKYFGAAGQDEEGYSLVPSGSGGIIYFNNGKTKEDAYVQTLYGIDGALWNRYRTQVTEAARLPIFGMKKEEGVFIASIEEGDPLASVNADIAGKVGSYNIVYPKFILRNTDFMTVSGLSGGNEDLTIVEKKLYEGNITVNYSFLENKEATYSDMANYYRASLVEKGILTDLEETNNMPLYIEILGGVEKTEFFVGVPRMTVMPMTTAKEANLILDELEGNGITSVRMSLKGWFNEGIYHYTPKTVDLEKKVASKKELQALDARLSGTEGGFYPDVAFQYTPYYNTKHYIEAKEGTRYIAGQVASWIDYSRPSLRMGTDYIEEVQLVNSPSALPGMMSKFQKEYSKLELSGLALRDLGDILNSDKNKKHAVDREMSKRIVQQELSVLSEKTDSLMLSGGNVYALGYAKHLVNAPIEGNAFYILDEEVPFYEMVIHGSIDYAGAAINLKDAYNRETMLLKLIETGSSPYFVWTYEDTALLENTSFAKYYSTCYKNWMEDAVTLYAKTNELGQKIRTSKIAEHIILDEGIRKVSYDNGISVYVNYTNAPYTVDGLTIGARDYAIGGEA